ncbi:MAG: alpha-amylase, partial [Chloroflexota bacterium]
DPHSLLRWYRQLIRLHQDHPALATGSFRPLTSNERAVAAFVRRGDSETVLVLFNFGKKPIGGVTISGRATGIPPGMYQVKSLLGPNPVAPLEVRDNGVIEGYVPLPEVAPESFLLFSLAAPTSSSQ